MTLVAPREIADLVYRCCRTAMIDAGRADEIAKGVVLAEMNGLPGLGSFVDHHEAGSLEAVEAAIDALGPSSIKAKPPPSRSLNLEVGTAEVAHQSVDQVAFAAGVEVDSVAFAAVTDIARSFLVPERILDAAVLDD